MIKDIMCKDLIVVDIDTDITNLSKTMKNYDIGFIPISKESKIVGVLTDRDIVTRIIANNDNKIEGYITKDLITVNINDDIAKALELMTKHKIKRLLVEDNKKLVGIISLSDILHNKDNIIDNIKEIFEITRNTDTYLTKVNEFYL